MSKLTHGEAWVLETHEDNLDLSKHYQTSPRGLPKQMSREDAVRYYNTKLLNYWIETMEFKNIKKKKNKVKAIIFLMFRYAEDAKINKEDICGI